MNLVRPLFDDRVAVAETDLAALICDESDLSPAERAAVLNAVAKRRREFVVGRVLARRAMAALGIPRQPVLVGQDRAPVWPEGIVGSITHTTTSCAVALAHAHDFRSIGVDVETATPVAPELWPMICTDAELAWLHRLPTYERGYACKMLFSAKETSYKAQYQLTREFCDFDAIEIRIDYEAGRWRGVFRRPRGCVFTIGDVLEGRLFWRGDLVATGVVVPH